MDGYPVADGVIFHQEHIDKKLKICFKTIYLLDVFFRQHIRAYFHKML